MICGPIVQTPSEIIEGFLGDLPPLSFCPCYHMLPFAERRSGRARLFRHSKVLEKCHHNKVHIPVGHAFTRGENRMNVFPPRDALSIGMSFCLSKTRCCRNWETDNHPPRAGTCRRVPGALLSDFTSSSSSSCSGKARLALNGNKSWTETSLLTVLLQ